ncbi:MBG domain-containing protein [Sphingobacterium sp. UT-1RO-CII-1]|uniref:MBG domain-containing protein n=1 Tax=Sphingobacterium sp. UT-1RO-CII-1 TaxID=2995225 RepID=UPI00227A44A5|nr:MBG domain-containing protein [Sphingobacterium sp. UT-1RO-CII-1]MCY4779339.1 MBG domain-containing protein [Sphingobacterium sp. UT-1RO-CII-1]
MKSINRLFRYEIAGLILSMCLFISLPVAAQLAVGSDGMFVKSGTPFSVNRLELFPSVDITFSTNLLEQSATDLPYNGTQSIKQVYKFAAPIDYQGKIRMYYETGALNGVAAEELMLVYAETVGGVLRALLGSTIDNIAGFVEYEFVESTRIQLVTAVSSLALSVISPDADNILYVNQSVDQTAAGYTSSGDSWANAIPELADALKWANDNKAANFWDTNNPLKIYVAKGTYRPKYSPEDGANYGTDQGRDNTFLMVENVHLYGGFVGVESNPTERVLSAIGATGTILSGDLDENDIVNGLGTSLSIQNNDENTYHVVMASGDDQDLNVFIDGFEITGGNADGSGDIWVNTTVSRNAGGGFYLSTSGKITLTLNNSRISGNSTDSEGGGIYSYAYAPFAISKSPHSEIILKNVHVIENYAVGNGGGIYSKSYYSPNNSTKTSASSIIFEHGAVSGNYSGGFGGGIFSDAFTNATAGASSLLNISLVRVNENYSNLQGGGIFSGADGGYSRVEISKSELTKNTAKNDGAAISTSAPFGTNHENTIALHSCTVVGNRGNSYIAYNGGKRNFNVGNSVFLDNRKADNSNSSMIGTPVKNIGYSLIQGETSTANGNVSAAGLTIGQVFTDSANGDYSLTDNSPAIDAGSNTLYQGDLANDLDLAGNPRLYNNTIDMGAYENQGVQYTPNADNILYVNQNVDQTAAGYTGSGNSWDNAIPELADALKWANDNKATNLWGASNPLKIYVAKGIYKPKYSPEDGIVDPANPTDNRDKSFLMVENVQLYGGFDPLNNIITLDDARVMPEVLADGVPKESSTILSGDIGMTAEKGDNAYHVMVSSGDVGKALVDGFLIHGGNATGGQSSIPINSNYIKRWNGGGIHLYNSCPVLRNLVISQNHADKHAGAIAMEAIQNYSFLYNILICHNTAEYGAAIVFWGAEGKGNFSNLTMYDNQSISSSSLFGFFGTTFLLSNSILVDDEWSQIGVSELKNTLLVGDDDFESIVWTDGGGNIITTESPFRNEQEGDFKLKESSQAQDAGNAQVYWNLLHDAAPSANPSLMPEAENESWGRDLAGERRFRGEAIDMGAYEYQGVQYSPNADNILYVNQNVDQTATGYTGSGDSWENAIPELADALKWARENHEADNDWLQNDSLQIYVAKGIYLPKYKLADVDNNNTPTTDRDKSFLLVNNVQLYGGFDPANGITELSHERIIPSVGSTPGEGTVLSGDLAGDDEANIPIVQLKDHHTRKDNAYHVVVAVGHTDGAEVKLDGFTISGGNANVMSKIQVEGRIIDRNYGGGIYFHSLKPVRLTNSMVNGNSTSHYGGGVHVSSVAVNLINSTVSDNYSGLYAGGICAVGTNLSVTMINSALTGNFAVQYGGGIYTRVLSGLNEINLNSSTLAGNKGSSYIYLDGTGTNRFTTYNSVVYGNVKSTDNSQSSLRANNLIIDKSIQYSLVQGESSTADGNLDGTAVYTDLFTDVAGGDYRLTACSPVVNAGSNSHFVGLDADTKDLVGNPRVYDFANGGIIDMGAYEFQGEQVNYDNVVFEDAAVTYNGIANTILATDLPQGVTAVYEIKDALGAVVTEAVNVGTYTVTATLSGCGLDKELTATLKIEAATLTVTTNVGQGKVYGDTDPVFTYTVSGYQGTDDDSILSGALSRVGDEDVGIYPIEQGDLSAGANYDVVFVSAQFTITKAILTVTANSGQGKVYGEADPVFTYTVSGYQGADDETLLTGALSRTAGEDAGTYPIGQGDLSAGANYAIDFTGADFAITQAMLTVTAVSGQGKMYGEADPMFTYTVSGYQGADGNGILSGALSRTVGENVGAYLIEQGDLSGGTNYAIDFTGADFAITQATLTVIAASGQEKVYGEADSVFTYIVSGYQGTDDNSILSGALSRTVGEDVGVYPIGQGDLSGGANYAIDFTGADFAITQATLTVTANSGQGKVYGEADPVFTYTVSGYQGAEGNGILSGALSRVVGEDVGGYTIEQGDLSAGANYDIDFTGADFKITKAVLPAFTFADASFVYDGTARSLKASGLPAGTIMSYIGNDRTEAGEYTVTANIAGGNNYEDGSQTAKLTIKKAVLSAFVFADASFVYDGTAKSLKVSDLPAGATVSNYIDNDQTEAGEYTVTAKVSGGNNYEDGSQTAKLTIKKAVLPAFTFDDASFVYDGTARSLTASGLPAGAIVSSYIDNDQTEAGEYTVTAKIAGGNNYEDGSQTAKLTIKKAALPAFTFDDASFVYDGSSRSLAVAGLPVGAAVTYVGNGQTEAGEYVVTATVDAGDNYIRGLSKTAKLTISPLQQVLSFARISAQYRDAGTVQLDITSNSDLPIQVFSDNLLVAEVQGASELLIKGVGQALIRAEQAGDSNHIAAQAVEQILEVVNDRGAKLPVRVHPAVSPNGDGINEFLRIEGIEQYPENKFVVFDANGAVIQRFEGYDNASIVFDGSKAGRPVPNGTYFYVLEVKIAGKWEYDKGYFVVRK